MITFFCELVNYLLGIVFSIALAGLVCVALLVATMYLFDKIEEAYKK